MRFSKIILSFIFIAFVFLVIMRLLGNRTEFDMKEEKKSGNDLRYVDALEIHNDSTTVFIEGQGRISSARKLDISSEVQGLLLQGNKNIKAGTSFRQGEILYFVKDTEAKLALQARKSSYLNMIANALPDIRLEFPDNYEVWKKFFEEIDITKPLPEIPVAKTSREKTYVASKNIHGEYYSIRAEEERIKKYVIAAPFDGSITEVFSEPGSVVNPGVKLISIIQSQDLEVEVPIDIRNIGWLKIGQEVDLIPSSGPTVYEGKIVRIGEYVSATTQSVPVFISINKKPGDILYNGMYLTARIRAGFIPQSFELPRRALIDENTFYFWKDSTLIQKDMKIEFVTKNSIIISGAPEGSVVVIEPVTNFTDSAKYSPLLRK
jgi:membrane fusion protein, multidrug efflux system